MNPAIQTKFDFYNIQLEYSTEDYISTEQSATYIEIGIDISSISKNDLFYTMIDMEELFKSIDSDQSGYSISTNHKAGILTIVFLNQKIH